MPASLQKLSLLVCLALVLLLASFDTADAQIIWRNCPCAPLMEASPEGCPLGAADCCTSTCQLCQTRSLSCTCETACMYTIPLCPGGERISTQLCGGGGGGVIMGLPNANATAGAVGPMQTLAMSGRKAGQDGVVEVAAPINEVRRFSECRHTYELQVCHTCRNGYYDPSTGCTSVCPGGASAPCSNRGACTAYGTCNCQSGYAGVDCSSCAVNHYRNAQGVCTYCHKDATCNGNGDCDLYGMCQCRPGYAGAKCDVCAKSYFNYPACKHCLAPITCNNKGTCDPLGNCDCFDGTHANDVLPRLSFVCIPTVVIFVDARIAIVVMPWLFMRSLCLRCCARAVRG